MSEDLKNYIDKQNFILKKEINELLLSHKHCIMGIVNKSLIESRVVLNDVLTKTYMDVRADRETSVKLASKNVEKEIHSIVDTKFNDVDKKFDTVNEKFDTFDLKLDGIKDEVIAVRDKTIWGAILKDWKERPLKVVIKIISAIMSLMLLMMASSESSMKIWQIVASKFNIF